MKMSARVPYPLTWHMCCIIVDYLGLVVSSCILNQSRGHWLLSDALNYTISMSLKFRDEMESTTFNNLMEEDGNVVYELSCLASNIKKEVVYVLDYFLFFLKKYEERKAHNVLSLMLTLGFKFFVLCPHLLVMSKVKQKSLFPMLLKCYYHLHQFEKDVVDQRVEKDRSLDISKMITSTSEPVKKLVNRELLIFKHYQVDVKNINCPL